ncbi:MAG: hypothetical protein JXA87_13715 [Thermoleophilia bacterium]|nr:hypothetical protein [Thermoleophilia bacterium]
MGVLLLVLFAALLACGCGGGGDEATTTSRAGVTTTAPPDNSGAPGQELVGTSVASTRDTPAEFTDVYAQTPIVLLFYVPGNADDRSVLESLNRLKSSFSGYTFLVYDYKLPEAYGDLSTLLKIGYPPELILIDKAGVIRKIWNGYVDEGSLNQGLVDLGRS